MYWRKSFIIFFLASKIFASDLIFLPKYEENMENNLDLKLLTALYDEGENTKNSINIYLALYEESKDKELLLRAVKLAYLANLSEDLASLLEKSEGILNYDSDFIRIKAVQALDKKAYYQANSLMQALVFKEKEEARNYIILATSYFFLKNYTLAYENFKKAYELDPSEENLLKLSEVLSTFLQKDNEALMYLNFHAKINGYSENISQKIFAINFKNKNFLNMNKLNLELYKKTKDMKYLNSALQIYLYEKNYEQAIKLLENYKFNNKILLDLYEVTQAYDKAYNLAIEEYEKNKNPDYLASAAIYLYESKEKNMDEASLKKILELFENSINQLNNDNYYNFYGYILIDHDIDIEKGLTLVKKALAINPSFPHYLDSLAWGYYKLGKCEEAKEAADKISKNLDATIDEHIQLINSCKSENNADKN